MAVQPDLRRDASGLSMHTLRRLTPLARVRNDTLRSLLRRAHLRQLRAGEWLFQQGDDDADALFLLEGEMGLYSDGRRVRRLRAGTGEANDEIAPARPRRVGARAERPATVLACARDQLALILDLDDTASAYTVSAVGVQDGDAPPQDDWMGQLLRSPRLQQLPAANIQAVLLRVQRRRVRAGDIVAKQGDAGDGLWFIVEGSAIVRREPALPGRPGYRVARLPPGASFGEESLITGRGRSASVVMETDGTLMKLASDDFHSLVCEPMLRRVNRTEAERIVANGGRWLDVRSPSERPHPPPGSLRIPLHVLRIRCRELDPRVPLVVRCGDGSRAAAGAFLLTEAGYDAVALRCR